MECVLILHIFWTLVNISVIKLPMCEQLSRHGTLNYSLICIYVLVNVPLICFTAYLIYFLFNSVSRSYIEMLQTQLCTKEQDQVNDLLPS